MAKIQLKPGDTVQVLSPSEILKTLDKDGTLDNLPFMPEMVKYSGKIFKVSSRVEKTCVECFNPYNTVVDTMKEFLFNDVVFLTDLRCGGDFHNGCQVGCRIFWKEAWLKKIGSDESPEVFNNGETEQLMNKLKTKEKNGKYLCQSTRLTASTVNISKKKRFLKLIEETAYGGISVSVALKSILKPKWRKMRRSTLIKGDLTKTPDETLNLMPGETVEIKSFDEIIKTLDTSGKNRGLRFFYGMRAYCGKKYKVRSRLEKMINEATGEMMNINNTVTLEDLICTYDYEYLGCPRERFHIWREIWLKRAGD